MPQDRLVENKKDKASLHKRYLLWLYKMTRDELDKIERKFTQLDIDSEIEKKLAQRSGSFSAAARKGLEPFLSEWKEYVALKRKDAQKLKFNEAGEVVASYLFLRLKLECVEAITARRFGARTLSGFKQLYEESSIRRIMEDTSGRR
jgi:hypothetical protein